MLKNRLIWLSLFILSLVAISFRGGAISYGFFFSVLLIPVLSLFYILLVFFTFKIYQKVEGREIVCKDKVPYYFTLQNEGIFGFSSVRVFFFSKLSSIDSLFEETEYELNPQQKIKKETYITANYYGEYEVGINKVTIKDFLGLIRLTFKNVETIRLTVLPKVYYLDALKGIDETVLSFIDSKSKKEFPDVTSREYVRGDDPRLIQWKLTSQTGKLYVREKSGEEKAGISIINLTLRTSEDIFNYLPLENRSMEVMLALLHFYLERNTYVETFVNKGGTKSFSGESIKDFEYLYGELKNVDFTNIPDSESLSNNNRVLSSKIVFLIISDIKEQEYSLISRLSNEGIGTVVYLISDDKEKEKLSLEHLRVKLFIVPTKDELQKVM